MLDIIIERTAPPDEVIRRAVCYFIVQALRGVKHNDSVDPIERCFQSNLKAIYLFINNLHNLLAASERQG